MPDAALRTDCVTWLRNNVDVAVRSRPRIFYENRGQTSNRNFSTPHISDDTHLSVVIVSHVSVISFAILPDHSVVVLNNRSLPVN